MVTFTVDSIPPSVNKLYFVSRGRKILSSAGRAWKNRFVTTMGGQSALALATLVTEPEDIYLLTLTFVFPQGDALNKGWGKDKRVKSPFKKIDLSNLIKLAEDSLAELLGIDDRASFDIHLKKRVSKDGKKWMKMELTKTGSAKSIEDYLS